MASALSPVVSTSQITTHEHGAQPRSHLVYHNLSYTVKNTVKLENGERVQGKKLVDGISLEARAGEMIAIMGPSGAGKSTLLDLMAFRKEIDSDGAARITLNGKMLTPSRMHKISSFVEQEDALLGVLTVRECVEYSLRLHSPSLSRKVVKERVERVLAALGLQSCAEQHIGTPISRGISGGQKRRVTAACAMVTYPRILLLDEITSGLDSTAAREVIASIRRLAVSEGLIVFCTIHQPSMDTLSLFDQTCYLSSGRMRFITRKSAGGGGIEDVGQFLRENGWNVPKYLTAVEHLMNLLNNDFRQHQLDVPWDTMNPEAPISTDNISTSSLADRIEDAWLKSPMYTLHKIAVAGSEGNKEGAVQSDEERSQTMSSGAKLFWNTYVLSERNVKNYSRNLLAYGVRAGMYGGMGFMLATIWIRLGTADSKINDRLSVFFYSVAFLAFMSVAGIPSFLEERAVFQRESKNGLYTTLPFVLANTLVNLPFLFLCTLFFTVVCYWAIGLHSGAAPFFRFLAFLYLAIVVAESQVLIIAAIMPIFVAALAVSAFMNGFWMSVGGYFIKSRSLPRFWFYSFHYMDYQKYSFELIAKSDLSGLTFQCQAAPSGESCICAYPSSTPSSCTVSGEDILSYLEIEGTSYGKWAAIMVGIFFIYRIVLYCALRWRS